MTEEKKDPEEKTEENPVNNGEQNLELEVKNTFKKLKRRILVYNSSDETDTILGWPDGTEKPDGHGSEKRVDENGNEVTVMKKFEITPTTYGGKEHFLLISIVPGPAELKPCKIPLNDNVNITFLSQEKREVTVMPTNDGKYAVVIGSGYPTWQLKVTRSSIDTTPQDPANVTVGDDGEG